MSHFIFSVISPDATYQLARSINPVAEGNAVTITLTTTGVQNGQTIPYTISGTGITSGDFVGSPSLTGNFVINNGSATLVLTLADDSSTEGTETFTVTVEPGASITVDVNDGSSAVPEYWISTLNTPGDIGDSGNAIACDANGNAFVCGMHNDTMSFVAKYNSAGTVLWKRSLSSTGNVINAGCTCDSSGNVYVVGYVDKGGAVGNEMFVAKYNGSSGALSWQRTLGDVAGEFGTNITCDSNDNIYACGSSETLSNSIIIVRFNGSNGNVIWQRALTSTWAGGGLAYSYGVYCDSVGNVYVAGAAYVDGGAGAYEIILAKYGSSGDMLGVVGLGSIGDDSAGSVVCDTAGNIYVGGAAALGEPYSNNVIFVAKYNSSLELQWYRTLGTGTAGAADDNKGIDVDSSGNVYVVGTATDSVPQIVICKYNSAGVLQWQRLLNGVDGGYGYGVSVVGTNVYVTGGLTADGAGGGWAAVVAKLATDGSTIGTHGSFTYQAATMSPAPNSLSVLDIAANMSSSVSTLTPAVGTMSDSSALLTETLTYVTA